MTACSNVAKAIAALLVGVVLIIGVPLAVDLSLFRVIDASNMHGADLCTVLGSDAGIPIGPEDGSAHGDRLYFTADDRSWFDGEGTIFGRLQHQAVQGGLYSMSTKPGDARKAVRLTLKSYPHKEFHPHGLELKATDDKLLAYVVNHRSDGDVVSIFSIDSASNEAIHLQDVRDKDMRQLNDVTPDTQSDGFFTTNWLYSEDRHTPMGILESYGRLGWNYLLYCSSDGNCHRAVDGISMPNGVLAVDDLVYVISTTHKLMMVYNNHGNGKLTLKKSFPTPSFCDNLSVAPDGSILTACHPKPLVFESHQRNTSVPAPSEVLQVSADDVKNAPNLSSPWKELLLDDGVIFSASTTAAVSAQNRVFVFTVFRPALLECELSTLAAAAPGAAAQTDTSKQEL